MTGLVFGLFAVSFLLLIATFNAFMAVQRAVSYPPRHVLKKRAVRFGTSSIILFLLAFTLYYVT